MYCLGFWSTIAALQCTLIYNCALLDSAVKHQFWNEERLQPHAIIIFNCCCLSASTHDILSIKTVCFSLTRFSALCACMCLHSHAQEELLLLKQSFSPVAPDSVITVQHFSSSNKRMWWINFSVASSGALLFSVNSVLHCRLTIVVWGSFPNVNVQRLSH